MTKLIGILLVGAATGLVGCYNTNDIKNGGLVCGANDACPDGFHCVKDGTNGAAGHCYRNGTTGDAAVKTDANPLACTTPTGQYGPFAGCNPTVPTTTSTCDPVCQWGCACDHRCVIDGNNNDKFVCETSTPPASFIAVGGDCSDAKLTACAPGSTCIGDDFCPSQCFRTCRQDGDCPQGSSCSVLSPADKGGNAIANVWLCTPPVESCNPTGAAACANARTGFACVFLAGLLSVSSSDATVCDCATMHSKKVGASCTRQGNQPDTCAPGSACVDTVCRQICDKQASGSACPSGGGCNLIYGSTRWGYCK